MQVAGRAGKGRSWACTCHLEICLFGEQLHPLQDRVDFSEEVLELAANCCLIPPGLHLKFLPQTSGNSLPLGKTHVFLKQKQGFP